MTNMTAVEMVALIRRAAVASVNAQAELGQERTREFVPKESHDLEESIKVELATPDDPTAILYSDSPYAMYQHEALYLEHPSGQAKFMESAVIGGDSARRLEDAGARAALRVLG